jgi:hypothetical protein
MVILQYGNKNVTNLTHLAQNTEWFIYNTCAVNSTIKISDLKWWVTRYAIKIKRQSIYHFYTLIMPCAVLSLCSILLFWLPPDSEEKIALGVTILLAFFVNSLVVSNYTPEASFELPVIGKYYAFNILLVALSLAGAVFILRLHFRGHKTNRVPKWIRKLFRIKLVTQSGQNHSYNLINHKIPITFLKCKPLKSNENESINKKEMNKKIKTSQKVFELLKNDLKKNKEKEIEKQALDFILIEWKLLAQKMELIFFNFNILAVLILPSVLFIKFWFQDLAADDSLQNNCACDLIN